MDLDFRPNGTFKARRAQPSPTAPPRSGANVVETRMLDILMLALVAASFALLGVYLTACERA
jgi:hypothetical protein